LEFGEVYFEDYTVVFYPDVKQEEIEERYILLNNKILVGEK